MKGINLNKPLVYQHSSLRYFAPHEYHIDRVCEDDVLLLVFEGVLRFTEDGERREVGAGEYYVQHRGGLQKGEVESETPQYLYIHFRGEWTAGETGLPVRGNFDSTAFKPLLEEMDRVAHGDFTLAERTAVFLQIVSRLCREPKVQNVADRVAAFMMQRLNEPLSLERLSEEFHFSKNHLINVFKNAFGVTPACYWNQLKLQKARHLLEATSAPSQVIAESCGFNNYSHFYRLFVRETGLSPAKWREQARKKGVSYVG